MTTMAPTGTIPTRTYKNGIELSVIGFGGILVMNESTEEAARRVAEAIERGVNYFDVAPQYGNAEVMLGPALQPYRKNCFLACKTEHRDAEGARADLKRSFERLRTDHFDLYQLHHITDVKEDVDRVFARGGAWEVIEQAKKEGRIRHVGFSAHSVEGAYAAMDRYDFDSILFPVNFATFYKGNFGPQVLERAKQKGVRVLALKALAKQKWQDGNPLRSQYPKCWYEPLAEPKEADLGLRFALSQDVTAAIPPGEMKMFRLALDIVSDYKPIAEPERQQLKKMADALDPIFAFKA
jgi:aryl-alcohol dehydrogenase-like predicted oxidoreductase